MTDQNQATEPPIAERPPTPAKAKAQKLTSLRRDPNGWLILLLGLGAPIAYIIAAGGSGLGLWGWQAGLAALPWIILTALAALVLAVGVIILHRRKGRKTRWPLLGLGVLATLGFLGYLLPYGVAYITLPAIHDITTDLADPPQFTALTLRPDNWDNIPGVDDGDMRGMNPRQRWATEHQDAYPDIRSVRIDQPVAVVIEKAKRLAEDRGWDIASVDPAAGNLEATDTVSLFRLKNDVVIRARAAENGAASIIDMRSVSRVGVHDLGVNAKRVRQFLSDLSGTTTAASQ
ncbi:DUF1499 domain-containing protein [Parasphingorhabdus sp.]|uniref:DUF1499 domain-containing protein n=1 Tax=Parasphingorhabdus sp. TaxID=2709688 RepID=UPI003A8E20A4